VEDRDYSAFLAEVRSSIDLVSVVSEHVSLKKAGRRFKGLCPFHDEKTPSFTVDADRNLFYCFGCNTGGDAFRFVMLREGIDFPEAARLLGERVGVRPPERRGPGADRRRLLIDANGRALQCFRSWLADAGVGRGARDYLEGRGVGVGMVAEFEIGFAPDAWDRLRDRLAAAGVPPRTAIEAGLLVDKHGDGRRVYDRFRNRIMFPIRSLAGEVVGFGGRTLAADEPAKYINSPESPVYVKGEVLFGLARARQAIREQGCAILVEGYLDLIGLAAAGFPHVVATLGTALTATQARLLRRYTERVVIAYDPDAAGVQATLRALEIVLGLNLAATVVRLPEGEDPDEFVRRRGADAFRAALGTASPAIEFLAEHFASGLDLADPRQRAEGVNRLLPFLARLTSPIERTGYLETIASRFRVDDDLVVAELRAALKQGARGMSPTAGRPRPRPPQPAPLLPAEGKLLGMLLGNPRARAAVLERIDLDDLAGSRIEPIVRALLEQARTNPEEVDAATFVAGLPDEASRALVARSLLEQEDDGTPEEARDCLRAVRRNRLAQERRRLQRELEGTVDPAALNELMSRKMELSRKIDALS
jgi:DNA primase